MYKVQKIGQFGKFLWKYSQGRSLLHSQGGSGNFVAIVLLSIKPQNKYI
jgi:hypothetical protein